MHERAADLARGGRAVRDPACGSGARCWPTSWIAVVVTGFFQTTLNFSGDDHGGRERRRRPRLGARVHHAVLDAAHRLARAARARARQPVARGGFRARGPRPDRRAVELERRRSRPSCGRCCPGSAGRRERSRPSTSSASTRSTRSISSRGRCWSACCRSRCCRWRSTSPPSQWSVTYALLLLYGRRGRDGVRFPAVDRDPALPAGRHGVAQHVRDSGDRASRARCSVFGERLTPLDWLGIALHRRRPCDHLGQGVAGEPPRRGDAAVADPARWRVGVKGAPVE